VEIGQNGWLTVPATPEIIFETNHSNKYRAALASLGISEELLSANSGNA
jgi:putative transcriptional regulator